MTGAQIRLFPDPVLRKSAAFVKQFNPALMRHLNLMVATMRAQKAGIGIAAPQIGLSQRMAVVDVSERVQGTKLHYLINPEIITMDEEIISREGCMSLPEYTGNLKRYNRIKVRWQDETGAVQESFFEGIEARCIQHEIDHLNGILFVDRVASLKTDMIPRQSRKHC